MPMYEKRRVAAYCRVSTDSADQLNSLEAQKSFFREYAERNGWTLVKIYADEGISGTSLKKRTEFRKMLADSELNIFEVVLAKDISRFARNTVDFLQSIRRLKSLGIETQFLTANMTNMGDSEFILTIFSALAQEESANISKRVKFGMKVSAEKGRVPSCVYGYDRVEGSSRTMAVNEVESEVVKRIFKSYVTDGMGQYRISKMLNEEGTGTKRNKMWSERTVCGILKNPLYTGRVTGGKVETADFISGKRIKKDESEWIVTYHPEMKIISDETFDLAQKIMAERRAERKINGSRYCNRYLFSGLIKCSECGSSFVRGRQSHGKRAVVWRCSNHRHGDGCSNKTVIYEDDLCSELNRIFAKYVDEKVLSDIKREVKNSLDLNTEKTSEKIRNEIERQREIKRRCRELYIEGVTDRETLDKRIEEADREIESLESALKNSSTEVFDGKFDIRLLEAQQLKRIVKTIKADSGGLIEAEFAKYKEE